MAKSTIVEDVIFKTKLLLLVCLIASCGKTQTQEDYQDPVPQKSVVDQIFEVPPIQNLEIPVHPKQPRAKLSYKQSGCSFHDCETRFAAPLYENGEGCSFPLAIVLARSGGGLLNQYWRCQYGDNPDEASGFFNLKKTYQGPCFEGDTIKAAELESLYLEGVSTLDTLKPEYAIWLTLQNPIFQYIQIENSEGLQDSVKILSHYEKCLQLWAR